jgi:hypothetical protein
MNLEQFGAILRNRKKRKMIQKSSQVDRKSYIYFIRINAGGRPIKIGKSVDVRTRYDQLNTFMPFDTELLGVMEGGAKEEKKLHRLFKKHHMKREWFSSSDEILEFVHNNASSEINTPTHGWSGRWFYEEICFSNKIEIGKRYNHSDVRKMISNHNDRYGESMGYDIVWNWKRSGWIRTEGSGSKNGKMIIFLE